jgi:hypothetical protein
VSQFRINAPIDSTVLIRRLKNGEKQLGYAAVNAINRTAKRIQKAERERVEREFTIRKKDFMRRQAAVIKPFASVKDRRAFAEIAVGEKPRLLLSRYERGAIREPVTPGAQFVAEPVVGGPARPSFVDPVTPALRMKRLRFDRMKSGKRRKAVTETGTYLIPGLGIFQRRQGESRMVYIFTRGKRLKKRLHWERTARKVTDRWFREEFEREVVKAIAHSKGGGL